MKISFTTVLNKISSWIKTNGNREITASQLSEILQDLVGEPEEFQLKYGYPVNNIYNGGIKPVDKTKSLVTLQAVLKLIGGKGGIMPIIGPMIPKPIGNISLLSLKSGDTINDYAVTTGDQILLSAQSDPVENGLYIIGENAGDTVRSEAYPTAESINGTLFTFLDGSMIIASVDDNGNTIATPANSIDDANFTGNLAGKTVEIVQQLANEVDALSAGSNGIPPIMLSMTWDVANRVSEIIEDLGSSKTLEKRFRYNGDTKDIDIMEIKNTKTNEWVRITYVFTAGLLTSTTHEVITNWTI